ncbi:MAG: ubiquinone/menaquinone biosynthesis methyltransferase [Candidatus Micrarchaeota archaeon]|nr:ubiquinone/menaquinone biosynthesis methyltransferase [Candidatus Micrarchaeota archaeon]
MSKEMNELFSDIHKKYDFMNRMLSLGMDGIWRSDAAKEAVVAKSRYRVLDVATGTGELAMAIRRESERQGKEAEIIGVDFNKDMLGIARKKAERQKIPIRFELGDALDLRFKGDSFDVLTSGFALRDFDSLEGFVKEAHRVLKKGGRIILMDMSRPERGFNKYFFKFYSRVMLLEGMLVDRNAYSFLVKSIRGFDRENAASLLERNGFSAVKIRELPTGVAFIITATK